MDVFDLFAKISIDTSEYESGLNDASGKTSSFGDKLKSGLATAAKVGAAAMAATTAAVTAFAKASIDTGMQFDSSMSQVAATMGVTVDSIQELRDFAVDMGAKTAFSATEAADALNYMALAGYDAETSMSMLPTVLNLAAAGGIDLASASDMVTDAQSALGLSIEETTEMVDKMAMASSKSNTSVAQLGEAFLTVGGTAKTLAGGTTELSTVLGILADNGVKGAEGGTALRNIILSLSAPTNTAAAAMKSLGLEAFDADGNLRPLNETFSDLDAALSEMTQSEQTQVLNTIFNKVDLKSVNALLANTGERFDELSGYIDEARGAAERMAQTQLDNLAGDVTKLKSALEGVQLLISGELSGGLREFVQFGTDGLSKVSDAFKDGGLSGAMDAFSEVLSDGLSMIVGQLPAAVDAGTQLLGAIGQGLIDNLPTLANAALQIGETLLDTIVGGVPSVFNAGIKIIDNLSSGVATAIPEFLSNALPALLDFSGMLRENFGNFVDAGINLIKNIAQGIADGLPVLIENVPGIVSNIAGLINDNAPKVLEAGIQIIITLGKGIIQSIPTLVENIPQIFTAIVDVMTALNWIDLGRNIVKFLGDGIKSMTSFVKDQFTDIRTGITDTMKSLPNTLMNLGKQMITNFGNTVSGMKSWVTSKISEIISTVLTAFKNLPKQALQIGKNLLEGLWAGISDKVEWLKGKVGGVVDTIKGWFTGKEGFDEHSPSKWANQVFRYVMEGGGEGLEEGLPGLMGDVSSVVGKVKSGMQFDTANVDFSASAVGQSSAALINSVGGGDDRNAPIIPLTINLLTGDARPFAQWILNDLIQVASANGTPIAGRQYA